jgi:hypothetical protein
MGMGEFGNKGGRNGAALGEPDGRGKRTHAKGAESSIPGIEAALQTEVKIPSSFHLEVHQVPTQRARIT